MTFRPWYVVALVASCVSCIVVVNQPRVLGGCAPSETRVQAHNVELADCHTRSLAFDGGAKEKRAVYLECADAVDRRYEVKP